MGIAAIGIYRPWRSWKPYWNTLRNEGMAEILAKMAKQFQNYSKKLALKISTTFRIGLRRPTVLMQTVIGIYTWPMEDSLTIKRRRAAFYPCASTVVRMRTLSI